MVDAPRSENWTDQRHKLEVTSTGIKIGIAYKPPPPRDMGVEAERIQSALLAKPTPVLDALMQWLGVWK